MTSYNVITIDFPPVAGEEFPDFATAAMFHLPDATGVTAATARDTTLRATHG
jgi:hypothetical protein